MSMPTAVESQPRQPSSRPSEGNALLSMSMMSVMSMPMSEENESSASIATTTSNGTAASSSEGASDNITNATNNNSATVVGSIDDDLEAVESNVSDGTATAVDYDYNPRIVPCPGYEDSNLRGYVTLESLIQDMRDYHDAANRASGSGSENAATADAADAADTITDDTDIHQPSTAATATTTATQTPSMSAEPTTSTTTTNTTNTTDNPAPTLRPTVIVVATSTPSTIVIDSNTSLSTSSSLSTYNMTNLTIIENGGTSMMTTTTTTTTPSSSASASASAVAALENNTLDEFANNRRRRRRRLQHRRRVQEEDTALPPQEEIVSAIATAGAVPTTTTTSIANTIVGGDSTTMNAPPPSSEEIPSDPTSDLGTIGTTQWPKTILDKSSLSTTAAAATTTTATTTTTTSMVVDSDESSILEPIPPDSSTTTILPPVSSTVILPVSNSSTVDVIDSNATVTATINNATIQQQQQQQQLITKVMFPICPNTELSFTNYMNNNYDEDDASMIAIETPARHIIEIGCLQPPPRPIIVVDSDNNGNDGIVNIVDGSSASTSSCIISGGHVHILIKHVPQTSASNNANDDNNYSSTIDNQGIVGEVLTTVIDVDDQGSSDSSNAYQITISGITFQGAQHSSILMNDPRGEILFQDCTWMNNIGNATMIINGLYNTTSTTTTATTAAIIDEEDAVSDYYTIEEDVTIIDDGEPLIVGGNKTEGYNSVDYNNAHDMTQSLEYATSSMPSTLATTSMNDVTIDDYFNKPSAAATEEYEESSSASMTATSATMAYSPFQTTLPVDYESGTSVEQLTDFNVDNQGQRGLLDATGGSSSSSSSSIVVMDESHNNGLDDLATMRLLEMEDVSLRSIITIENCLFSGGKGNATILFSSHYQETLTSVDKENSIILDDLLNNGNHRHHHRRRQLHGGSRHLQSSSHSIHLFVGNTSFTTETVNTSIINNYGGRLQLSHCSFLNNTADSMIQSEHGSVAMASTEFSGNNVHGKGSIVLDSDFALEENTNNCLTVATMMGASVNNVIASKGCVGINAGGICSTLQSCAIATNVGDDLEQVEDYCFSDWDDLVVAVHNHQPSVNRRNYIICPGSTLIATSTPVIIDSDNISIQCGTTTNDTNCVISGGFSHFHIVGMPRGVVLERLIMSGATGSSIMALGKMGATLTMRSCDWMKNKGASAILIHNNYIMSIPVNGPLDIMTYLSSNTPTAAMSVDVSNCVFANNELTFGSIANIGGMLTVQKSRFNENSGMGGDIVVTNYGNSEIRDSCFTSASSMAPGTIFVQDGSSIRNLANHGFENTAGSYGSAVTCVDVFMEAKDANCLVDGTMGCNGACESFESNICGAESRETGELLLNNSEGSTDSINILPIAVASIVAAFVVFGFVGIVARRRNTRKNPSMVAVERSAPTFKFCCRRKRNDENNQSADEEMNFDDDEDYL